MKNEIYITSLGIVSALGIGEAENARKLQRGISGIKPIKELNTKWRGKFPAGEIPYSNDYLLSLVDNFKFNRVDVSRTLLVGALALQEALSKNNHTPRNSRTGFIGASSVGGMQHTEEYFADYKTGGENASRFKTHDAADCIEVLAKSIGLNGFVTNVHTACASSTHAIILGYRMIKAGLLDTVIVGGMDTLSKLTLNGFNSLLLLDRANNRPFDADRKGINLGEGAAFMILQSEEQMLKCGNKAIATIKGYGLQSDGYHMTSTSPKGDGLQLAMRQALSQVGLKPSDIGYINAHGTATPNNDLTEGMAMKGIFNDVPPFSSTKAFTGHCLSASGIMEAVFSIFAMRDNFIPPNLNFSSPIKEHGLEPSVAVGLKTTTINYVMSNSLGMGGYCSSLILSKN